MASVCTSGCVKSSAPSAQDVAVVPMSLKPVGRFEFPVSAAEREWYRTQLVPRNRDFNESQCLHMLHVHGVDATFRDCAFGTGKDLLRLLLDSDAATKQFGQPCFVRTRFGLRVPDHPQESRSDESHRDQTLAVLGHLGLPSDTQITLGNEVGTIREAIHDSIATFDLSIEELEWSALTYALYLPPAKSWENRFGKRFTFDMLVDALRSKSFRKASCGGSHLLSSLTMILRSDQQCTILSEKCRHGLVEFLASACTTAVATQRDDGSWSINWHRRIVTKPELSLARDNALERLIATGHIAEWMLYLPKALQPPEEVYRKAALWLASELRRVAEMQAELFCPFTHGLVVVQRGSEKVG